MVIPFPDVDPVLIHIWGKLAIRWYSLSYIAGLVLGWWWILRLLRDKPLWRNPPFNRKAPATEDDVGDLLVWATLGVIIGGRIGWVLFYGTILCSVTPADGGFCGTGINHLPGAFLTDPIRLISAWDGGMSFHGGLLGMLAALWLFTKRRKLDFVKVGDLVASVAPIGLFFGKLANFINGELWGKVTDVPWAMVFCSPTIVKNLGGCPAGTEPRHPSQLYEAGLEGLLLFVILQVGIKRFRWHERPGVVSAVFFLGYGLSRVFVELFREPDAPFLGPISMGQFLSVPMWAVAAYFFWYAFYKPQVQPQT